jgi:hypothetical protein
MIDRYNYHYGLKLKTCGLEAQRDMGGATKSIPSPLDKYIVILLNPVLGGWDASISVEVSTRKQL